MCVTGRIEEVCVEEESEACGCLIWLQLYEDIVTMALGKILVGNPLVGNVRWRMENKI
jgi:hypothetical protein